MKMYNVKKPFNTLILVTKFKKEVEKFVKCKTDNFNRKMDMSYRNVDFIHDPVQLSNAHSQISYILERLQCAKYETLVCDVDFINFPMSFDLLTKIILSIEPEMRCYETIVLRMCEQNSRGIISNFKWLYALILISRKVKTGIPINIDPKNAMVNETTRFIVFDDKVDCKEIRANYSGYVDEIFRNGSKVAIQSTEPKYS